MWDWLRRACAARYTIRVHRFLRVLLRLQATGDHRVISDERPAVVAPAGSR
jgi:hypothetical protein